jgi:prepilin-type N-terminal cleavage/methylation domain-containing protein
MSKLFKRFSKAGKGFTLVELLVVTTILAILFAMTIPNYLKTRPQRLLGAQANKIGQIIRYGRLQAVKDNKKYYLEFIPELDMYRLWGPSGWFAYADPFDLRGDWDGDGLFFYAPDNDPDDYILDPRNPDNVPIHTVAPKLKLVFDPPLSAPPPHTLVDIYRDFETPDFVAGQAVFPYDVDLRLNPLDWNPGARDLITRPAWPGYDGEVFILSRTPLMFIVFFPDGTVASSWQYGSPQVLPADLDEMLGQELRDLEGGQLGVTEIFLQVRGVLNPNSHNLFTYPQGGNPEGGYDIDTLSPYETLGYEQAIVEAFGRRVLVNHATGRIRVEDYAPINLDDVEDQFGNPVPFY